MKNILCIALCLLVLSAAQTCTDGQLIFEGRCVDVPYTEGCNTYAPDATCTLCDYGYSLAQHKCTPNSNPTNDCCAAYAPDGSCTQCSPGLLYNDPHCIRRHIHACLLRQGAQCAVCAAGYALSNGLCLPRIAHCSAISQEGECVGCQEGWTLVNAYCLPWVAVSFCALQNANGCVRCQDGYFLGQDRNCHPVQPGCLKYWQGKCLACHPAFQTTAQGFVIAGCLNYTATGCSQCQDGLTLENSRCVWGNCVRWSNNTCLQCKAEFRLSAEGCVSAANFGCQTCQKGFLFLNGSCVPALIGCLTYSKAGICSSCSANFNLTVNGICQITGCELYSDTGCTKCSLPFQLANSLCSIPNCRQSTTEGCTVCEDTHQLSHGQCFPRDPLCATYAPNDKGVPLCQSCVARYYLKDGSCLPVERGCIYDATGKCSCATHFAMDSNGKCQIPGCSDYNENVCVGCSSPFVLSDSVCGVANCDQISWNGCDICKSGYLLANLQCKLKDANCLSYAAADCQSCKSGFLLDQNKWCYRNIPNCLEISADHFSCSKCNCDFLLVNGDCKPVLPNCRLHNADATACLACADKFHLLSSACLPNDAHCLSYSNATDTQTCLSCIPAYFLAPTGCLKKQPGCIYSSGVCSSCSIPFYYDNSTQSCFIIGCSSACDLGCDQCADPFTLSSAYKNCTVANCAQYSRNSCTGCLSGFTLKNGRCENVDVNCESYSNSICQKCKSGYSLISNRCYISVDFCEKYYSNGNSTGCCAQCRNTHYLGDSKCVPKDNGCIYENKICKYCSTPFQKTAKGNSCEIPNCLTTNLTSCVTCKQPFVLTPAGDCTIDNCMNLQDGLCVQCRPQFHPKLGAGCVADNPNCLSYDCDGICELCANDLVLTSSGECEPATKVCLQPCASERTKCLSCSQQYFLNRFYQCEKRDGRCSVYTNGVCSVCQKDYFLYAGICFPYTKGCVKYEGKDCVQCRDLFSLRNGECFKLAPNSMKLLGDGDIYDFPINPIDVRQSKYFIENCDSVCEIGTAISSSFQTNFSNPLTGWKAVTNDSNQWIGFSVVNGSESFYVVQIEGFGNGYITSFYLEYSLDGVNFIKVQNKFDVSGQGNKTTIYFTGIYCRAIRLRVASWVGWVSAKVEFFYYDALRFKKISNLKSLKYLNETISSNFVDRVDNQIYINQAYFFNPVAACTSKELCFTGLQLCEPRKVIGLTLTFADKDSQVQEFYLTYTIDGRSYNCFNGCAKITVGSLTDNSWKTSIQGLNCQGVRIYPTKFKGSPQFAPTFYYE